MAALRPLEGWTREGCFTMEQARDPGFRAGLQDFIASRLKAETGRITTEDAARLVRRIVGDALCGEDHHSWRIVCILTDDEEQKALRKELVRHLLGVRPEP